MSKFSQTEWERKHGLTLLVLRQRANAALALHLPQRWGKDNRDEAHPQGTLKDQGRRNACLWMTHWGCTAADPAVNLERILCSQSHGSAPSYSSLTVVLNTLLPAWQREPVPSGWRHQLRAFLRSLTIKCCTLKGSKKIIYESREVKNHGTQEEHWTQAS